MSHSRVETGDDMAVDEAGVALPTPEWMEAARKAADTDGILENASAKRQKVCISCCTLTSPHPWSLPLSLNACIRGVIRYSIFCCDEMMNVRRCLSMITEDKRAHTAMLVEPVEHGCERGCIETGV